MKMKTWLAVGAVVLLASASGVLAGTPARTFRSPAAIQGVIQDTDLAAKPVYDFEKFIGADLVNLALGTALGTVRTNEVLALEFACDSSSAQLVVYDKAASNNIATIATSSRIDVVQQQDRDSTAFPNRERYVAHLDIGSLGNGTNGLTGGYITIAGRVHLDPATGCPRALRVDTDHRQDNECGDPKAVKDSEDKDPSKFLAGRAHFVGVLDVVTAGTSHTILVPAGALTIRRQLLP